LLNNDIPYLCFDIQINKYTNNTTRGPIRFNTETQLTITDVD